MKESTSQYYRCPATGAALELVVERSQDGVVESGTFQSKAGSSVFPIQHGIPDFTWPKELAEEDRETRDSYESIAEDYDNYASLPFLTYRCSEAEMRERMVDQLELEPNSRVLEIGCGTGRGALHLAKRLGPSGELFLQELTPLLLDKAIEKLSNLDMLVEFSIANGSYLPFQDNFFDAAHHFGGINTFADIPRCLSELARVVKPGGKVVVGDESLGPWLADTEFGRVMSNSNPLLKCEVPLASLPVTARDVRVEWIVMGAFYTIEFRVAEGPPDADYHLQIPSERGGSHWTRYYGQLEGVTDETKALAHKARKVANQSMHDWLEAVVRDAAKRQLSD